MFGFIKKKLSYKIMFALFFLLSISNMSIIYFVTLQVANNSIESKKDNLSMLSESIFQSLRNAMNTGDVQVISDAEKEASQIKGVDSLFVAKSKPLIELYAPDTQFTKDEKLIQSFNTKQTQILEIDDNDEHKIRMIKPMIAKQECLMCHANQQTGDVVGVIDLTFSLEEVDSQIQDMVIDIFIIASILGWITLFIVFFIVKKATDPLTTLKDAIWALTKYSSANQEINVKTSDEIGEVAKYFNIYQKNIRDIMVQDQAVVEAVEGSIHMVRSGFFNYKVQETTQNRSTEDLKNAVNEMISDFNNKLEIINKALIEYGNGNFDYKFNIDGTSGHMGSLVMSTKALGNNVSELLAMILQSGEHLSKDIDILSKAALSLSQSSNEQAASLEETAASVDEIANNIKQTTLNVTKMAALSDQVLDSTQNGQNLANQTSSAMNEINSKIDAVNEAIEVIDQIAFQTNILSLNAAVEAATAGEAGKGFAVVAGEVRNLASRSAEAANEIKTLVESTTQTAKTGKNIADDMIGGYKELSEKIFENKEMIDNITTASKEQERGIAQINDAINILDKNTQENASDAQNINNLANSVKKLSDTLIEAASYAQYDKRANEQICDIALSNNLNKLKLDHIVFKEKSFENLETKQQHTVTKCTECNLGKWMNSAEQQNHTYTQSENWKNLQHNHENVHQLIQQFVNSNADINVSNNKLVEIAKEIEASTEKVFESLNQVKRENCQ